jgi:hypothetical protein
MTKIPLQKTATLHHAKAALHQKRNKHRQSDNHPKKTNHRLKATFVNHNQAEQDAYELDKKHVEFKLVLGDTLRV